jgi:anaerobic magnesium-protoporphyrin IX monomethyl ester cyclase
VNVLLFSMPDTFEHTPPLTMRMPNGALASLAGNVDAHHTVAIADLILARDRVPDTIRRLIAEHCPDVVGLSVMTFQRHTAREIVRLVRSLRPSAVIVAGGYDPSLAPDIYEDPSFGVDVIVRGEGDITFRELLRALERDQPLHGIAGLSFLDRGTLVRNQDRHVSDCADILPPRRGARVLSGYTMLGRPIDVVETSRGCTFDCSFCSIINMRGRNFHPWPIARVIVDIADARQRGARSIFLVDDNVTLNLARFRELCDAIVAAGLNDIDFIVQAMTSAIAAAGEELAIRMRRANFRYVFLGIENVLDEDLAFLRASSKNATRGAGRTGSATLAAVDVLHRHGLLVVGGLIVGNPGDTRESIEANLAFARKHVDWPYIQHPTPYPGTPMTRDFEDQGLIVTKDVREYDGTTAVVRTAHLSAEDIEFMRWRAERWMKARHFWPVLRHDTRFALRHGAAMLRHTFRGSRLRTWLGVEPPRAAFRRYREIRAREREFFGAPARGAAGSRGAGG